MPDPGLSKHSPGTGIHRHVAADRRLAVSGSALDHTDPGTPPDGSRIRKPGKLSLRPDLSPVPAGTPPLPRPVSRQLRSRSQTQYPPACSESIVAHGSLHHTSSENFIVSGCDQQLQSQTATVPEMFTRLPMNKEIIFPSPSDISPEDNSQDMAATINPQVATTAPSAHPQDADPCNRCRKTGSRSEQKPAARRVAGG